MRQLLKFILQFFSQPPQYYADLITCFKFREITRQYFIGNI